MEAYLSIKYNASTSNFVEYNHETEQFILKSN